MNTAHLNFSKEHNTIKSGGFTGHSFIQFTTNGYGYNGFAIFQYTGTTESYLETVTSTYVITRKHPADYSFFYVSSGSSSNNATGTNARTLMMYGTGSSYTEDYSNVFQVTGEFRYHGDSNPFFFRIGVSIVTPGTSHIQHLFPNHLVFGTTNWNFLISRILKFYFIFLQTT